MNGARPPSKVSGTDTKGYRSIERTIREIFPQAIVAPSLTVAGTDSYRYSSLAEDIYRFSPILLDKEDLKRIHGIDERVGIDTFADAVRFYGRLIDGIDG